MYADSARADAGECLSGKRVVPKLHPSLRRRSKLASNPMARLNQNSTHGRLVNDIAARLLESVEDRNPIAIADCLALAELRIRADEMRRDPASDPNVVIKLEGLVDRRTQRLFGKHRNREPSAPDLASYLAASAPRSLNDEGSSS
jgi:hypothetical protein